MSSGIVAGASRRFAHLTTGLSRSRGPAKGSKSKASSASADDDDEPEDDSQDDEPKGKKSKAAEDDDDQDDEPKGKRSKASDDDDDDQEDEPKGKKSKAKKSKAAEDDDDQDDEPKGKRSKASDDDDEEDDDDGEMHGRSAVASARRRERARCAAIFATPQAAANPALAASLAFETKMTRQEAIKVLKGQGNAPSSRSSRSDRNPNLDHGNTNRSTAAETKAGWGRAFAAAGVPGGEAKSGWGRAIGRAGGR